MRSSIAREMRIDSPHIIIIGAGLIGLSTADFLLKAGARVTVIDEGFMPMRGTSFSNSGMLHPSQAFPWGYDGTDDEAFTAARDVFDLAQRSVTLTRKRIKALGLHKRTSGTMQLFDDEMARHAACATYDKLGVAYKKSVAADEFGARPTVEFPKDHSGNAFEYGVALAVNFAERGAVFITGSGRPHSKSGRVIGVEVGRDIYAADHVILAAGVKSFIIASEFGIDVPIYGDTGFALNFVKPEGVCLPDIPLMHASSRSAFTVFSHRVRLSGTMREDNAEALRDIWGGIAPNLMRSLGEPIGKPWRGVRPMSLAGRPYIGETTLSGLWVNSGHGHMGWTLCMGSGELMANMIMRGSQDPRFALPQSS